MILNKKVTVLMPVYNGEKYLKEAIRSILNQTYKDFDFLIINDGSVDSCEEIIKKIKDKRICYIKNEKNIGLISTLNKGLNLIQSEYIVRMDQDDISMPKRIEKQLKYMGKNKNIAVSGTGMVMFNEKGKLKKHIMPIESKSIRTHLLFYNALMHPTVIIRKSILDKENYRYNLEHKTLEDYGLWQKISFKYDMGNISEILLKYRIVETGITQTADKNKQERDNAHIKIYKQAFEDIGMELDEDFYKIYRNFLTISLDMSDKDLRKLNDYFKEILIKLDKKEYNIDYLRVMLAKQFVKFLKYSIMNNDLEKTKLIIKISKTYKELRLFSVYGVLQRLDYSLLIKAIRLIFNIKFRKNKIV